MKEIRSKSFKNGTVYALRTDDNFPIEVTDTFLPFYTKDAIGRKQNMLKTHNLGSRNERWMVGVSCMSGCPVGCKFCATGQLEDWRCLTAEEIVEQFEFIMNKNLPEFDPYDAEELKINYTRMGEPFLNIEAVRDAMRMLDITYHQTAIHHYISTVGIQGSDFSWIEGNTTLQISLHSLDESRRKELIPIPNLMTIEELGSIRTDSKLKTTVNLTLVDYADFDAEKLKKYFDPEYFFIKLSPINVNAVSEANHMGKGVVEGLNIL